MIGLDMDRPTAQIRTAPATVVATTRALSESRTAFTAGVSALAGEIADLASLHQPGLSDTARRYTETADASAPVTSTALSLGVDRSMVTGTGRPSATAKLIH